jgi:hypothetical protein
MSYNERYLNYKEMVLMKKLFRDIKGNFMDFKKELRVDIKLRIICIIAIIAWLFTSIRILIEA